jgi:hypothetical protein
LGLDSDALKSNHLCKRHNSAFGALDSEIGRFFRAMMALGTGDNMQTPVTFFSALDLERWIVKTIFSLYRSGWCGVGPRTHDLPHYSLELLKNQMVQAPAGLWVPAVQRDDSMLSEPYFVIKLLEGKDPSGRPMVVGVRFRLSGFDFLFLLVSPQRSFPLLADEYVFRPAAIELSGCRGPRAVVFSWPDTIDRGNDVVVIQRGASGVAAFRGSML